MATASAPVTSSFVSVISVDEPRRGTSSSGMPSSFMPRGKYVPQYPSTSSLPLSPRGPVLPPPRSKHKVRSSTIQKDAYGLHYIVDTEKVQQPSTSQQRCDEEETVIDRNPSKARTAANPVVYRDKMNGSTNGQYQGKNGQALDDRFVYETRTVVQPASPFRAAKVFHCQLAHGSPTGLISGLNSIKDVYHKVAECYDIASHEIIFCTLNTHKIDMRALLGGQLGFDDFIFAHTKGQKKEVEIEKTSASLGLTITDNGAGYAFIKRIKPDSVMASVQSCVFVGDHIEKIGQKKEVEIEKTSASLGLTITDNGAGYAFIKRIKQDSVMASVQSCVFVGGHIEKINDQVVSGWRHFDVAKHLKDLPVHSTVVLRLIEPMKAGFANIGPRGSSRRNSLATPLDTGNGRQTIRFKAKGHAVVQDTPNHKVVDKINGILETYIGISDEELALRIWEIGQDNNHLMSFLNALQKAPDLIDFQLPDDVALDLWGAVNDVNKRQQAVGTCSIYSNCGDAPTSEYANGPMPVNGHNNSVETISTVAEMSPERCSRSDGKADKILEGPMSCERVVTTASFHLSL